MDHEDKEPSTEVDETHAAENLHGPDSNLVQEANDDSSQDQVHREPRNGDHEDEGRSSETEEEIPMEEGDESQETESNIASGSSDTDNIRYVFNKMQTFTFKISGNPRYRNKMFIIAIQNKSN